MSRLRFQHVFFALMCGAFVCAFVVPPRVLSPRRMDLAGIFNPLSFPLRRLAEAVRGPAASPAESSLSRQAILEQNDQLRQEVVRLQTAVDRLGKMEAEREQLGDLKSQCVRVPVAGDDAGGGDALILAAASTPLRQGEAVVYPGGLAGRLEVGFGGTRVRLLSDSGFAVTGAFVRFVQRHGSLTAVRLPAAMPLVQGLGHGMLAVSDMKAADFQAAGLRKGDWVVLNDSQWPAAVQGVRIGQIVLARPSLTEPGFMDIRLSPGTDLMRLSDVWVLNEQ
jgi:hypothetical protein